MTPEHLQKRIAETSILVSALIRRVVENPDAPNRLPGLLETLSVPLWPGAVFAALRTPQDISGEAYGIADNAIASAMRTAARPEIVAELYNLLPRDTVALQLTALEVSRQSVLIMEEPARLAQYPLAYLEFLNNYTGRLLQMSRIGDAETEGARAVKFADDSTRSALPGIGPARAAAYENQAHIMRETQRASEALSLIGMAREVYEGLIGQQPEFKRSLAICLSNHIAVLTALKRYQEAVRVGRQAAQLFREMLAGVKRTGGEFVSQGSQASIANVWPGYAICLIALAAPLNEIKEYEESLADTTEAVSILSQLVKDAPDLYPLLGQAQNSLAMALNAVGRFEEAESPASAAVETFRRLDRLRPGSFVFYLAHSLRRQSFVFAKLSRMRDALSPCEESAVLYGKLEDERPGTYTSELTGTREQREMIRDLLRTEASARRPTRGNP